MRVLPNERAQPKDAVSTALPESDVELPPIIRRAELVAFALVSLLLISVFAVLYFAKAFFLPVAAAFVVGTMPDRIVPGDLGIRKDQFQSD